MKIVNSEKMIEHPMELVLDIEPGTTLVEYKEVVPAEVVEMVNYDSKDKEIEAQYDEVYNIAINNVTQIADEMDRVEGKFKARIGEVTATMLNVALTAARDKANLKAHKDKTQPVSGAGSGGTVTNNNLIVADRNEIIRMMMDAKKQ